MPMYGTLKVDWKKRKLTMDGMLPGQSEYSRLGILRFLLEPGNANVERRAIVSFGDQLEFYDAERMFDTLYYDGSADLVAMLDLWLELKRNPRGSKQQKKYVEVQDLRASLADSEMALHRKPYQDLLMSVVTECFAVQPPDSPAAREARLHEMSNPELRSELKGRGIYPFGLRRNDSDRSRWALREAWAAEFPAGQTPVRRDD